MQTLDYDFIKRYKQKQFAMRHPAPQIVIKELNILNSKILAKAVPEDAKEVPKQATEMAVPEDAKEVPKQATEMAVSEVANEVPKQATEMAVSEVANEVTKSLKSVVITDDDKQTGALQLIKSALEQINFALHLLEEVNKKPIAEKLPEKFSTIPEESEPIVPEPVSISEPIVPEPVVPAPKSAELVKIDHISDVEEDITIQAKAKEEEKEEEEGFKIFMPKKSKNKKTMAAATILPVKEKMKKDEYPSLSSSFTPIKASGSWKGGDGKKTLLEISKEIAHIPSPTPTSSPSPNLRKTIRTIKKAVDGGDDSEEDIYEDQHEFQIRKRNDDFDGGY
jgi:hypothetical protein